MTESDALVSSGLGAAVPDRRDGLDPGCAGIRARRLVLFAGLPRSGKSTAARRLGWPIVNPDSIRLAMHGQRFYGPAEPMVWAVAQLMAEALFLAGHSIVVIDATNGTAKRRAVWEDLAKRLDAVLDLRVIATSPLDCIERALAEGYTEIVPVIGRMAHDWDLGRPESWGPRSNASQPEGQTPHATAPQPARGDK